jgi:hypothetical protein
MDVMVRIALAFLPLLVGARLGLATCDPSVEPDRSDVANAPVTAIDDTAEGVVPSAVSRGASGRRGARGGGAAARVGRCCRDS